MSSANDVPLAPPVGIPGQHATLQSSRTGAVNTATNSEASAALPFGRFTQRGTTDKTAKLLTAAANVLAGLVVYSHSFCRDVDIESFSEEEEAAVKAGVPFGCAQSGEFWVIAATNVDPTSDVHLFHTVGAAEERVGRCGAAASAAKTTDISAFARWKSTALAGAPARLEFDLRNAALATADV